MGHTNIQICHPLGHLLSTAEVEAAFSEHPAVAEAAVVSCPHTVKGECLYCFITLKDSLEFSNTLKEELKRKGQRLPRALVCSSFDFIAINGLFFLFLTVREKIGPIATPDFIQNAPGLPKTRSGMISSSSSFVSLDRLDARFFELKCIIPLIP